MRKTRADPAPGTLIQVSAGTEHNVTNIGRDRPCACTRSTRRRRTCPGTVHQTKAEADRDEADHPLVGATV